MDLNLQGRVVIVTGGGSNIGRGIVHAFAREGAIVVTADINEAFCSRSATEALERGARDSLAVVTDVTRPEQVERLVQKTLERFGTADVLVNNVGAATQQLLVDKSRETMVKEMALNLWGAIDCCKAVLPHMISRKSGSIVNISSGAGRQGMAELNIYSTAKFGVIGFTQAMARETGSYGIRVNSVAPGAIHQHDPDARPRKYSKEQQLEDIKQRACIKRLGTPTDIANATVFLASDAASYITGQTLSVCGGMTFH